MKEKIINDEKQDDFSETDHSAESLLVEYKGEFYGESAYYIGIGSWSPQLSVESKDEEPYLNLLEAAAITCILEDAVDELIILKYVIGAPIVPWEWDYKTPKERFTRRLTSERIHPEVDNQPVLTSAIKLQRDREQIEVLFIKLIRSLIEMGSYVPLVEVLQAMKQEALDDQNLIQELKKNLVYVKNLKERVEEKRRLDDLEEKERDELLYQLQDDMDDVILKCEVEEKFVNKWENVRYAQNQLKLKKAENVFKNGITKFATQTKLEKRVTHEFQLYIKTNQAELEEQLEEWMALYDSELEARENKILHLKYNRDQAEERHKMLTELYEKRKVEMKEWIAFREIRKRRAKASLLIQSWWRGMMVRKKLGPYKPKKQKAEKGEKKKKKK